LIQETRKKASGDGGLCVVGLGMARKIVRAYRMLGSRAEAEDAVQDTFMRWQEVDRAAVRNPVAWLTTTCTRRHDVFELPYPRIAETLEVPEATCRKLVSRARSSVGEAKVRADPPPIARQEALLAAFHAAIDTGDATTLAAMLSEDVEIRLLARRVSSSRWHTVVYAFVLGVEILVAVLLWRAVIAFFAASSSGVEMDRAVASANVALSGFLVLVFVMLFGRAWFVYYIKQEGAQITHFALLCVGLLATLLVNS
jgi:hypothetical protein